MESRALRGVQERCSSALGFESRDERRPQGDVKQLLLGLVILLSVFPYFSPIRMGIDTSPLYLLPALSLPLLAVATRRLAIEPGLWAAAGCWLLLGFASLLKALVLSDSVTLRVALGLIAQAVLIVGLASAVSGVPGQQRRETSFRFFSRVIYWGALIWASAALLQLASRATGGAIPDVTYMLVSATRTTEGRGITAMAAEPSFAGITCCILAAAAWILTRNGLMRASRGRVAIACYVLVTLLSASLTSYIALSVLSFFIARRALMAVVLIIAVAIGASFLPWELLLNDLRIVQLVRTLASSPTLILADASAASRVADILGRLLALGVDSGVVGHLLTADAAGVMDRALTMTGGDAEQYLREAAATSVSGGRAMSSIGLLAFEFGVVGLAVYVYTMVLLLRLARARGVRGTGVLIAVGTFGYTVQLPFSFPTVAVTTLLFAFAPRRRETASNSRSVSCQNHGQVAR